MKIHIAQVPPEGMNLVEDIPAQKLDLETEIVKFRTPITRAMTRETRVEHVIGLVIVAMALPLAAAVVVNVVGRREWWLWALPLVTIAYLMLEFVLDHVLKVDFRHSGLLTPYLILFYLGQFAMIGYSFGVGKPYGFITLVTYFINLAATFYSYARVRHG